MKLLHISLLIFCLACSGHAFAQIKFCSGDSVVLVLNGHKQGNTIWEQSADQATWSTASGTAYNDSLVLTATNTFYYRAIVTDSICTSPFYSDTVLVTVRPAPTPPTAKPATGIAFISFNANWSAVAGITSYYLDVAKDNGFTSFVSGYNNIKVNDTTYAVTKVLCDTTYYYRVRIYDDTCGLTSSNSNTITVTTLTCPPVYCTYKSTCNGNITDSRDSKTYRTIQIGTQCWMAQNLNVGTAIPYEVQQTNNTILEKYCYGYGNANTSLDSSQCATYGGLYLWNEMMAYGPSADNNGPQGICPTGWHLPTDEEWKCLEMTLGMSKIDADKSASRGTANEGNKLKTKGKGAPPLWADPSAGTDSSGFSALPGGDRGSASFYGQGIAAFFWTATEIGATNAWYRWLTNYQGLVSRDNATSTNKVTGGYSVRCVKNF